MSHSEKSAEKRWIVKSELSAQEKAAAARMAADLGTHPVVAELLYARGHKTEADMRMFLTMEKEMLCNPFDMKDMDKAVERILSAVKNGEKITVYGDYDVDGVTSVSVLCLYLRSVGADADYYIPNRATDGYGVNTAALEGLKKQGTSLVITVDTGITAAEETEYARSLGMDLVITDHHECHTDLPRAAAVVNPHRPDCPYPFKELAGVGVVFKLISAMEETRTGESRLQVAVRMFASYADLVAIGTIADVMPVCGENRIIIRQGLAMIEENTRTGIRALMDAAASKNDKRRHTKITSGYIGYTLAPRINAAGRLLSATIAVELFLTEDYRTAYAVAEKLCRANKDRQAEENKIIKEAAEKIKTYASAEKYPVIVLDADTWHHGVIGIVSSRITEKYCRPSILVSFEGSVGDRPSPDDIGKGSGRSVRGLNLVDALCYCSDKLVKFGGHELAAGLSVTRGNLPEFREMINRYARENLHAVDMTPTVEADLCLDFSDLTLSLAEALQIMEPYGVGNPPPVFVVKDCFVKEMTGISDGKHTRFTLSDGTRNVVAMYFSSSPASTGLCVGDMADAVFSVDINEWLGRRTVQLILKDIRPSEKQRQYAADEKAHFAYIWNGGAFDPSENILPTHDDFAAVYRMIVFAIRSGHDTLSEREMLTRLSAVPSAPVIGYVKLMISVKVLMEMNIVGIEETNGAYRFSVRYTSAKADLEKSSLLRRLRQQQKPYNNRG